MELFKLGVQGYRGKGNVKAVSVRMIRRRSKQRGVPWSQGATGGHLKQLIHLFLLRPVTLTQGPQLARGLPASAAVGVLASDSFSSSMLQVAPLICRRAASAPGCAQPQGWAARCPQGCKPRPAITATRSLLSARLLT